MRGEHDAVVMGSGPNGLVAAPTSVSSTLPARTRPPNRTDWALEGLVTRSVGVM